MNHLKIFMVLKDFLTKFRKNTIRVIILNKQINKIDNY
jgi:hypothetical protein